MRPRRAAAARAAAFAAACTLLLLLSMPTAAAQVWKSSNWTWDTLGGSMLGTMGSSTTWHVVADSAGNCAVADTFNHCIRYVTAAGNWSVIGGNCGLYSYGQSNAGLGLFNAPRRLFYTASGLLYVGSSGYAAIRMLNGTTWSSISTPTYSHNGSSSVYNILPHSVALDAAGKLYFSSIGSNCVYMGVPTGAGAYNWTRIGGTCGTSGYVDGTIAASLFKQVRISMSLGYLHVFVGSRLRPWLC